MNPKILIILLVLIGLSVGGFFVYKNIAAPEKELEEIVIQPVLEIPESALESKFGYMAHHGDWQILQEERERYGYLSWERNHPGFANWQEIEPKEGEYHWEMIDQYVRASQEKDIQILFTVWPFTDWDQENCNLHLEWQPNDWGKDPRDFLPLAHRKGKPCDMEAYQEFLRLLVDRYDGDGRGDMPGLSYPVKYWEIGNEPDGAYDPKVGGLFFQGSVEDYFEILKMSYMTIKEVDPNAMILIAAIPSLGIHGESPEWIRPDFNSVELFELGVSRYFDIMNLHESARNEKLIDVFKKYGAEDKPIWITEPWGVREYIERAEEEDIPLAILFKEEFEKEFQYGVERIFIGGPESIDQALYEAILTIETPGE